MSNVHVTGISEGKEKGTEKIFETIVTENINTKLVCQTHSEAKKHETVECGAEKVYCKARQGEQAAYAQKAQTSRWV